MREAQVPRRVAPHRMAAQKHAIRVDGESPAGVAQTAQHGGMFAGREFVFGLSLLAPVDRDDDIT